MIGVPDARTGERACAVVVLAEGVDTLTLAEIIDFCRSEQLATQKIPEQLHLVDALPRNSMGKILKQELRASVLASHGAVAVRPARPRSARWWRWRWPG